MAGTKNRCIDSSRKECKKQKQLARKLETRINALEICKDTVKSWKIYACMFMCYVYIQSVWPVNVTVSYMHERAYITGFDFFGGPLARLFNPAGLVG
jgi:hypothetical protein